MASTKLMFLGILIMLLGLALVSAATQLVIFRAMGADSVTSLAYIAVAAFAVGLVIGLIGFFRE